MTEFNQMQTLKRRFFAMRNGVLAETLRKGGSPYEMIFGLNLPQLNLIASELPQDKALALRLLKDSRTRESQLLASMVMPAAALPSLAETLYWIESLRSLEAIDVACLKLLKKVSYPLELARHCISMPDYNHQYTALRLLWNIYNQYPEECRKIALGFSSEDDKLRLMAKNLIDEIDFITSEN